MIITFNNETKDSALLSHEFKAKNETEHGQAYVTVCLESGDFLTITGAEDELKHLCEVLENETISVNMDDFGYLDYYVNMNIQEVVDASKATTSDTE